MRDAFGGAFMIRLFLVFLFIYIFFTAIALNYAKAFKVKNRVIDYLEDNEIVDLYNMNAAQKDKLENFFEIGILGELNYRVPQEDMECTDDYNLVAYCKDGIKIYQINSGKIDPEKNDSVNTKNRKFGTYYRVETYFTWNLGFLTKLLALGKNNNNNVNVGHGIWTISGESRTIMSRYKE